MNLYYLKSKENEFSKDDRHKYSSLLLKNLYKLTINKKIDYRLEIYKEKIMVDEQQFDFIVILYYSLYINSYFKGEYTVNVNLYLQRDDHVIEFEVRKLDVQIKNRTDSYLNERSIVEKRECVTFNNQLIIDKYISAEKKEIFKCIYSILYENM